MRRGFTLIELLLVMSIIGILSTLGFTNYLTSLKKAKDAERKSDLNQIQKALELYKLDQATPAYPAVASWPAVGSCWSSGASCTDNIYMRSVPGDGTASYYYDLGADSLTYTLAACLENSTDPQAVSCPAAFAACLTKCFILNEP